MRRPRPHSRIRKSVRWLGLAGKSTPAAPLGRVRASHLVGPGAAFPADDVADEMPLLLFSYDLQSQRLLQCNNRVVTTLGYTKDELLAMGSDMLPHLLHQDELKRLRHSNLDALLARGRSVSWTCRMRHHDGHWRWMRLRVRASFMEPSGKVQQLSGNAEDITRRRAAVAELRHNRHFLRQIVDIVPNLLYVFDLVEQRNVYCNSRVETLLGYSEAEMQAMGGQVLEKMLPPEEAKQFRQNLTEAAQLPDHESCAIEYSIYHRDGSLRWFYATHTPFERSATGEVLNIIGMAEDVTERREAAERNRRDVERLAEQHRLFREVIDAIPNPVYLKDGKGNYLLANRSIAEMYGLSPEELVRRGRAGLPGIPQDIERYTAQDQQVLATHQDLNTEETYTMPDGSVLWFNTLKRLFVLADGTEQVLGVDSNITELKTTQLKLQAAKEEAEQNVQAKQDFLANMSHEIRTPLHGIIGLAGVLAKTTLSSSQLDYLRLLNDSAEHLLTVLNDVLTTARLGAGKLRPEQTSFAPKQLLLGCAALLRPRAREKNLRLRVDVPPLPPVLGDAHRLRQVMLNLVSNAIKFTQQGEVRICCEQLPGPADAPAEQIRLKFSVQDTGIGVAPEVAEKIFEPFTQATASTDREYGGSGLGLSISKGLVELMGGELRLQSVPGEGSEFSFILPLLAEAKAEPEAAAPAAAPLAPTPDSPILPDGGRVLLVEDNVVNSLLAETLLRNWGWQVTAAFSGAAAVELFADREFDVVLMDIQMPGMDGETAARHLREHPNPERAATPIVALTARTMPGEAERLLSTGFDGYLAKPYKEDQLLDVLRSVLNSHAAEPLPTYQTTSMPSSTVSLYDLGNVRQLVRNDEAVVRRLAWAFIETTPAILSALDDALLRRDWQALSDAAHHLKASIDGLGVASLRQVVREVEGYSADTPPAVPQATRNVSHIREVTEQVMTQLRTEFPEK